MKKLLTMAVLVMMAGMIAAQNPQWVQYTSGTNIYAVAHEGNFIWVGMKGCLVKIDKIKKATTFFNSANSELIPTIINSIAVDTDGVKWLGTDDGLIRFDGVNWTIFNKTNSSIPQNHIKHVMSDNGGVWVLFATPYGGTPFGVSLYKDSEWITYDTSNSGLASNTVYDIDVMKNGNKCFSTDRGFSFFNENLWTTVNTGNSDLQCDTIYGLATENDGDIWVSTHSGISKFNETTGKWINYTSGYPFLSPFLNLIVDGKGVLWMSNMSGAISFDGENWTCLDTANSGLPSIFIKTITIDNNGIKYFGATDYFNEVKGGLVSFDDEKWSTFNTSNSGIAGNSVYQIYIGKDNTKWFSSTSESVWGEGYYSNCLNSLKDNFWTHYNVPYMAITSIGTKGHDNELWLLGHTYMGFGLYAFDGVNLSSYFPPFYYEVPHSMEIDQSGLVWVPTFYAGGLLTFNGTEWTQYNTSNSGLPSDVILSITFDNDGRKWIGTGLGLCVYDDNNWTVYDTSNSGLPFNGVEKIAIDKDDVKWLLVHYSAKSLVSFDGENWNEYEIPYTTGYGGYDDFAIDHNGKKWIVAKGKLLSFDGTNWTHHEIYSVQVTSVAVDALGNKWIGTNYGVFVYNDSGSPFSIEHNPKNDSRLRLYPNPSSDLITIECEYDGTLSIFNLNGKLIQEQVIKAGSTSFDVSSLPAGMYVLRFVGGIKVQNVKFVKS